MSADDLNKSGMARVDTRSALRRLDNVTMSEKAAFSTERQRLSLEWADETVFDLAMEIRTMAEARTVAPPVMPAVTPPPPPVQLP